MDILYILGEGSKHDDIELKWSLRSVAKYGKNVGRIIVSGRIPDWLSDEVVKVPDENGHKLYAKNNLSHVYRAIDTGAVSGTFLLSADDHFYVRSVDFDDFPLFVADFLPERMEWQPNNEYFFGLYYSRKLLEANGLPFYNTSLHNNIPVDADSVAAFPSIREACEREHYRTNPWAVLGNLYLACNPGAKIFCRNDIKITENLKTTAEVGRRIGDSATFSIADSALESDAFVAYMNGLLGEKCRYEK